VKAIGLIVVSPGDSGYSVAPLEHGDVVGSALDRPSLELELVASIDFSTQKPSNEGIWASCRR